MFKKAMTRLVFCSALLTLIACESENVGFTTNTSTNNTVWQVNPNAMQLFGETSFKTESFYLTNTTAQDKQFTVSSSEDWVTISPAQGTVEANKFRAISLSFSNCTAKAPEIAHLLIKSTEGTQKLSISRLCGGLVEGVPVGRDPTSGTNPNDGSFDIELRFADSNLSLEQREIIENASKRWESIIVGDVEDFNGTIKASEGRNLPAFDGEIDDLLIDIQVRSIDGASGTLAQAGPYALRTLGSTLLGTMVIDIEDLANIDSTGGLESLALHEIGHILGLGSLWEARIPKHIAFDREVCQLSSTVEYVAEYAVAEYVTLGGQGNIPIESEFALGTKCSHWDEDTFQGEIMTGFIGEENPISRMTIAALKDSGYEVDLTKADDYKLPEGPNLRAQSLGQKIEEAILPPVHIVD